VDQTKVVQHLTQALMPATAVQVEEMAMAYKFKELREKMKDPCWKGYRMLGTKKKGDKEVPNCVPESAPAWTRKEGKNPTGGLNRKGIASYRREHPGSKLSMAVTTPPSTFVPPTSIPIVLVINRLEKAARFFFNPQYVLSIV